MNKVRTVREVTHNPSAKRGGQGERRNWAQTTGHKDRGHRAREQVLKKTPHQNIRKKKSGGANFRNHRLKGEEGGS